MLTDQTFVISALSAIEWERSLKFKSPQNLLYPAPHEQNVALVLILGIRYFTPSANPWCQQEYIISRRGNTETRNPRTGCKAVNHASVGVFKTPRGSIAGLKVFFGPVVVTSQIMRQLAPVILLACRLADYFIIFLYPFLCSTVFYVALMSQS